MQTMKRGRILGLCGTLAGVAFASSAGAAGPADQAAAVELFQEAKRLMAAGDYEHACPKFTEAQRLLPTPGTLLNIGLCYEKAGKIASAYGAYKEAEVFARNANAADHQAEAQKRAAGLALKVAKLAIVVPPEVKVPGFELRRDGTVVGEAQWGSSMPADVGWHQIEATAPGKKAWSTTVRIETDGSSASVNVPALEALPDEAKQAPRWGAQRIAGVSGIAAGGVGLVLGAVFGGLAIKKASDARSNGHCDQDWATCDATGMAYRADSRTMAHVSTSGFVIGSAALAAGIVLFVTTPTTSSTKSTGRITITPMVGGGATGLAIGGGW
jgi:hypothetical protein